MYVMRLGVAECVILHIMDLPQFSSLLPGRFFNRIEIPQWLHCNFVV